MARSSENDIDPIPQSFAHLAISQSFFKLNGALGLSPPPSAEAYPELWVSSHNKG